MKNNEVSVIIPAKNEEEYLPRILDSLLLQNGVFMEIIVSVSPSTTDKTALIAEKNCCKVVEGGRLATGRNNGAKNAIFDTLFFMDADTYPEDKYFLSNALEEFHSRKLDVAGTLFFPDFEGNRFKKFLYKFLYDIENYIFLKREKSYKPKMRSGIFLNRNAFFSLDGFKEGIFGEDSEIAERAIEHNPKLNFGILRSCGKLKNSVRRYEREGFVKTLLKILYLNVKAELFGYNSLKGVHEKFYELK